MFSNFFLYCCGLQVSNGQASDGPNQNSVLGAVTGTSDAISSAAPTQDLAAGNGTSVQVIFFTKFIPNL